MEALRVEGVSKHYGGVQAVQNVSLSIEGGERRVIIGLNGAGKTTLLKVISGEAAPTTGRIYLFGQEITTTPIFDRVRLGLARSFQITNLCFNLTTLENTLLGLQALEPSRFQMLRPITAYTHLYARAQELLESIGLWEKRDMLVAHLSYGEQRLMDFILALTSQPKLLLLDEPTSGVAIADIDNFVDIIRNLNKDVAMLIVAHNMEVVFSLADRITVMHRGEILAEGTPEQIQDNTRVKEVYLGEGAGTW